MTVLNLYIAILNTFLLLFLYLGFMLFGWMSAVYVVFPACSYFSHLPKNECDFVGLKSKCHFVCSVLGNLGDAYKTSYSTELK